MATAPTLPTAYAPAVPGVPPLLDVVRHESAPGSWEMARRTAHPALVGLLSGYCGYREDFTAPVRRREVAAPGIVLIISFGDPIRLASRPGVDAPGETVSFVAGLHNGPTLTEHAGVQAGVQVDLTPLGAYTLLGLPMSEIADRIVPFEALAGAAPGLGADLPQRLAYAPGGAAGCAVLDAWGGRRLAAGPVPRPEVARSWDLLAASAGRVGVAELAAETGWSRRHLTARFREQVGLPPKSVGKLMRFRKAVRLLGAPGGTELAVLADACGYYDQAHLNRDFRELAGCSPTAYLAHVRPDGGGVAG
ncbi:helix-turn-helix domain-containing protein [Yinghuangia soli]|uniref:Helix-turn-helix domain-containing protein n=1 Tax=Yinghuangia soli TaxID=2908204 RepID=A0AA41TZT9_9ACTN|nr:helix-turn-helix domain-containing protein [Yinghuangia soli]MCF2527655.1 helix-turn-helix domain-containing protein [Yinghuangia soli]